MECGWHHAVLRSRCKGDAQPLAGKGRSRYARLALGGTAHDARGTRYARQPCRATGHELPSASRTRRLACVAFPLEMVASRPRVVGEGTQLTEEGAVASMPSLSPDGSKLAHELSRPGIDRSEVWVMDIDGGGRELIATNARAPVWSRDGTQSRVHVCPRDKHTPPFEGAVAYRRLGGTERFLTPWSSRFTFVPGDWTPDSNAVLGVFLLLESGTWNSPTSVALWPTSNPRAEQPQRILLVVTGRCPDLVLDVLSRRSLDSLYCDAVGQNSVEPSLELAVARPGTPPEQWVRIAPDHEWPDKPQLGVRRQNDLLHFKGIDIASQSVGSSIRSRTGPADWRAVRADSL